MTKNKNNLVLMSRPKDPHKFEDFLAWLKEFGEHLGIPADSWTEEDVQKAKDRWESRDNGK